MTIVNKSTRLAAADQLACRLGEAKVLSVSSTRAADFSVIAKWSITLTCCLMTDLDSKTLKKAPIISARGQHRTSREPI